jgi:hypothetical protein
MLLLGRTGDEPMTFRGRPGRDRGAEGGGKTAVPCNLQLWTFASNGAPIFLRTRAGRPDELVKKMAQSVAQHIFCQNEYAT